MKRHLLFFFCLLFMGSAAMKGQAALLVIIFGEKAASENFYFSMKGGLNYSMITNIENGSNRLGLNFGLINNIRLTDRLQLAPEFIPLSHKGLRNVAVLTTGNPDLDDLLQDVNSTDRRLSYLEIPVLLKVNLGKRWSVRAGPQFSYLTSALDIYSSKPIHNAVLSTEVNIKEEISSVDLSAVIDVTYMVSEAVGGKGLNLYIRYVQGFVDLYKDDNLRYWNSTLQFGAAFPFIEDKSKNGKK